MSPTAIGIEVVPMLKRFRNGTIPGSRQPKATPMTMAAKIHAVRERSRKLRRRDGFIVVIVTVIDASLLSNAIHFFFQREAIEGRQRKREKKADAPFENKKRVAEGAFDFGGVSLNRGRIGNSPVRGHRLSRPQRAGFLGGVVANREDEVHRGSAGTPEFVPAFTAQAGGGDACHRKLLQRFGTNRPGRMTSSTVGGECRPSFVVEDRVGHDGARRVSRAQEQNVVMSFHGHGFGFTARTKALMNFSSTCAAIASTSMPEEERNSRASSIR